MKIFIEVEDGFQAVVTQDYSPSVIVEGKQEFELSASGEANFKVSLREIAPAGATAVEGEESLSVEKEISNATETKK